LKLIAIEISIGGKMNREMTAQQATRKLGITMDALYRLIYAGRLPARKESKRWMIPSAAVEARLKQRGA
jgi:excisionase family DNA binding protein